MLCTHIDTERNLRFLGPRGFSIIFALLSADVAYGLGCLPLARAFTVDSMLQCTLQSNLGMGDWALNGTKNT